MRFRCFLKISLKTIESTDFLVNSSPISTTSVFKKQNVGITIKTSRIESYLTKILLAKTHMENSTVP